MYTFVIVIFSNTTFHILFRLHNIYNNNYVMPVFLCAYFCWITIKIVCSATVSYTNVSYTYGEYFL